MSARSPRKRRHAAASCGNLAKKLALEDKTVSVRFEGEKAIYQINWTELLDLEEKPVMLDDLVNGMQVLAPYFKADGQIAHHAATVCSKSLGSGKLSATEELKEAQVQKADLDETQTQKGNGIKDTQKKDTCTSRSKKKGEGQKGLDVTPKKKRGTGQRGNSSDVQGTTARKKGTDQTPRKKNLKKEKEETMISVSKSLLKELMSEGESAAVEKVEVPKADESKNDSVPIPDWEVEVSSDGPEMHGDELTDTLSLKSDSTVREDMKEVFEMYVSPLREQLERIEKKFDQYLYLKKRPKDLPRIHRSHSLPVAHDAQTLNANPLTPIGSNASPPMLRTMKSPSLISSSMMSPTGSSPSSASPSAALPPMPSSSPSGEGSYLGYLQQSEYRVKVSGLSQARLKMIESRCGTAVGLAKELFKEVFHNELRNPESVCCTKTSDERVQLLNQDYLRGIRLHVHAAYSEGMTYSDPRESNRWEHILKKLNELIRNERKKYRRSRKGAGVQAD